MTNIKEEFVIRPFFNLKNFCFLISFVVSFSFHAQLTEHKLHLQTKYSHGILDTAQFNNYSLTAEFIIHNHFGLNYNFDWMYRSDNIRQVHTPMGLIGGPFLIVKSLANSIGDSTGSAKGAGIILGILILILPDGLSYHIPIAYNWDLSPYANLLGLDFIKNKNTNDNFLKYACSFGVKSTYCLSDRITLSGFLETRQAARFGWGFAGGIGVGFVFGKREIKTEVNE
jgi:hypothetical protein